MADSGQTKRLPIIQREIDKLKLKVNCFLAEC